MAHEEHPCNKTAPHTLRTHLILWHLALSELVSYPGTAALALTTVQVPISYRAAQRLG